MLFWFGPHLLKERFMTFGHFRNWLRNKGNNKGGGRVARTGRAERKLLRVEQLEERVLMDSTQAFPAPLDPMRPLGSLVFTGSHADRIEPAGETDTYTLRLDPGQTAAAVVR